MRSNYKKLGGYISAVNQRNSELKVQTLLGVSIKKILMPSIANTIGTNMKTYKIIQTNQFAYGPVTSRNGDKISIALLKDHKKAIVSQAYTVFEITDHNKLHPEYLMMWFSRPEFDRYARFKSHGSARETFDWDEMCDIELPIPSIEKQHAIVQEYQTITKRIQLNEQLNQKLEETAQAIYKHWFVDFEFPDENGKPYKSSGGKIVYNEELEMEVPKNWVIKPLSDFCTIKFSKRIFQAEYKNEGIPFYRSKEIILKKAGKPISNELYINKSRYNEITNRFGSISKNDILLTAVGTIGVSYFIGNEKFYFKDGNLFWLKEFSLESYNRYIYQWMQDESFINILEEITFGSTQKVITTTALYKVQLLSPPCYILDLFTNLMSPIHERIKLNNQISAQLYKIRDLLLSKMSKIEFANSIELS